MKKIIITGVSSFIGYHLAQHFKKQGYLVIGTTTREVDTYLDIQKKRLNLLQEVNVRIITMDLTNIDQTASIISNNLPDYWIHHGGYAKNYGSFDYDLENGFVINTAPLYRIYPLLKNVGCKGIIITGTNAEYNDSDLPAKESDNCLPSTPYGLSKLSETIAACQLSEYYQMPTRIARVFIPFGIMDSSNKLIPYLIGQLNDDLPVDLSPCEQKRDFIYIKDLVAMYESLINDFSRQTCDILNITSGNALKLKDFIIQILNKMNKPASLLNFDAKPMRRGEPYISYGSNERLIEILGYSYKFSMEEAINDYLNESLNLT